MQHIEIEPGTELTYTIIHHNIPTYAVLKDIVPLLAEHNLELVIGISNDDYCWFKIEKKGE